MLLCGTCQKFILIKMRFWDFIYSLSIGINDKRRFCILHSNYVSSGRKYEQSDNTELQLLQHTFILLGDRGVVAIFILQRFSFVKHVAVSTHLLRKRKGAALVPCDIWWFTRKTMIDRCDAPRGRECDLSPIHPPWRGRFSHLVFRRIYSMVKSIKSTWGHVFALTFSLTKFHGTICDSRQMTQWASQKVCNMATAQRCRCRIMSGFNSIKKKECRVW